MTTQEKFMNAIRDVIDFPKPGIIFKDITTALKDADVLSETADLLYEKYKDMGITQVVGIESRGFILGSILAYKLGAGMVLMRKPGKLPAETYKVQYDLEYGTDSIEIHKGALSNDDIVLLHDDLLATGGSASAAIKLINKFDVKELHVNFLIELDFLKGQDKLPKVNSVYSMVHY
ncbi:MAG: adenine phosphoribosyltransferase [Bacteroidales bacterium]|nr:adenine phosphoribosyltransferase [Bacteroidales bacterium]